MNIISIDPSLTCTAMCINGKFHVYTSNTTAKTKTEKFKRWFSVMEPYVEYRVFDGVPNNLSNSETEIAKINLYNKITDMILSDIALNMNDDHDTLVCMEGYSHSKATSSLLDLVAFSTLLRSKLLIDTDTHLMIISPSTLKVRSCELTYGARFNPKGKRISCINCNGVSGGRFKKPEMLEALLDNEKLASDWYIGILRSECSDIMDLASIPKPIEDMNDAKLMYEIILDFAETSGYDPRIIQDKLLS